MKWTVIGLMMLGVIAAGAAAILVLTLNANAGFGRFKDPGQEEIEIMVATKPLPAMAVVNSESVARMKVKRAEAPEGVLTNPAQVIGQVLVTSMVGEQPFTVRNFAKDDSGVMLATTLPAGKRAMSLTLGRDSGISDLLYPGSIVDVYASFKLPSLTGGSAEVVSATILQNIHVLAVGKKSIVTEKKAEQSVGDQVKDAERIVTLSVDSNQAEMLQLAMTHGEVSLAMRNPLDKELPRQQGTRLSDLSKDLAERIAALAKYESSMTGMALPEAVKEQVDGEAGEAEGEAEAEPPPTMVVAPAQPAEPPVWITEILRGKLKETQKFPLSEAETAQ